MSKRGTENQLTKDEYERDDDDDQSSSVMGTFRKASNDELAKRPIRAMRRLGSRTSSNVSDDGAKKVMPFSSLSSPPPNLPPSQERPNPFTQQASKPNPFANINFGTSATTTAASSAVVPAISQSTFSFGALPQPAISTTTTTSATAPTTQPVFSAPTTDSPFAKGTFTFNVGSNATPIATPEKASADSASPDSVTVDREGYERALRGINQNFLKKIQKDLENNPIVNLAQIFNTYLGQRIKIRKKFLGVEEPQVIVLNDDSDAKEKTTGEHHAATRITRLGAGAADSPKIGFGLPVELTAKTASKNPFAGVPYNNGTKMDISPTAVAASLAAAAAPSGPMSSPGFSGIGFGGFGSSSMKGAVDPPRNPTASSAWSFGVPSNSTSNSSGGFSFGSTAPFAPASTAASTTSIAPAATTPAPFSFNPPKPFAFSTSTPKTSPGSTPPKPFAFQVPSTATVSTSSSSLSSSGVGNQDDNEGVPDDTKSQLLENREGEQGETTVYDVRAKLFGLDDGQYKDLGVGQFRVNENDETKKRRMIMRTGGTGMIKINSWVIQGMLPKVEKNVVTLFAIEDGKPKKFMVRVKEASSAEELYKELMAGQNKA